MLVFAFDLVKKDSKTIPIIDIYNIYPMLENL
jgi:hypothetical protein